MWLFPTLLVYMAIVPVAFTVSTNSCLEKWSKYTCQLFSELMDYMDRLYDPDAGYLFDPSGATAITQERQCGMPWVYLLETKTRCRTSDEDCPERY